MPFSLSKETAVMNAKDVLQPRYNKSNLIVNEIISPKRVSESLSAVLVQKTSTSVLHISCEVWKPAFWVHRVHEKFIGFLFGENKN